MTAKPRTIATSLIASLFLMTAALAGAQAVIKAEIGPIMYDVDDTVRVRINISNNPGLHGLYFDLNYDGSVLDFEELKQADLTGGYPQEGKVRYAVSASRPGVPDSPHLIVAYTLDGPGVETEANGTILEAIFRVKNSGASGAQYAFSFSNQGVVDEAGNSFTWMPSEQFGIRNASTSAFIHIAEPYPYQVLSREAIAGHQASDPYASMTDVSVTLSEGNYNVKIFNEALPSLASPRVNVTTGVLSDVRVHLKYEFNTIKAELYDNANVLVAVDTVTVYLSPDGKYVKIKSPADHSLLNADMAEVRISSSFEGVEVNGVPAAYYGEPDGQNKIYLARVWLAPGFNTLTASAIGPQGVVYQDRIDVYYQKDSGRFGFLLPLSGQSFKPAAGAALFVKGEIGSMYRGAPGLNGSGPEPNVVTLDVRYSPADASKSDRMIKSGARMTIAENDYGYSQAQAKYVFYNDFAIPLNDLGNGELIITAYKNREGNTWDDMITRIAHIDDNRLWIDLVQPNVFATDVLDTEEKLVGFNEQKPYGDGSLSLGADGAIGLSNSQQSFESLGLPGIAAMEEAPDGTLYALQNVTGGIMRLYRKNREETAFTNVIERSGVYGYDLECTDVGLLVAVSHLFSTTESGVYLYANGVMKNVAFSTALPHVQFLANHDGKVYLYGNYYSDLYSFDVFSLEEEASGLRARNLSGQPLSNNEELLQFVLSPDAGTAVVRTISGSIQFYDKTSTGYAKADVGDVSGMHVVAGYYSGGTYETYLVLKGGAAAEVVMKEIATGKYSRHSGVDMLKGWLLAGGQTALEAVWAGFRDGQFHFIYRADGLYYSRKGEVFFGSFFPKGSALSLAVPSQAPVQNNHGLFRTSGGESFLQCGPQADGSLQTQSLCRFASVFSLAGAASFNYVNDDVEGLSGFSFEVDSAWLAGNAMSIGFTVRDRVGVATNPSDPVRFTSAAKPLSEFLALSSDRFTVSHSFDPAAGREIVHVEFNKIEEKAYLHFELAAQPAGNRSPAFHNLTVHKKIPVILARDGAQKISLPIQGYIHDRTVEEVRVQHALLPLGRDGSFSYALELDGARDLIPVEMTCVNGAGEQASLTFTVKLVESLNAIGVVEYKQAQAGTYQPLQPSGGSFLIGVTSENVWLNGKFYGLAGAVVGYELYQYRYANGEEKLVLMDAGLFQADTSVSTYADLGSPDLGPGYRSGAFADQRITLQPGVQRLVLYCENPGGKRVTFAVADLYPEFNYSLAEQKIIFDVNDIKDMTPVTVGGVPISQQVGIQALEADRGAGASPRYRFSRDFGIRGRIQTVYDTRLILKSFTPGLTFADGSTQTTIDVDEARRFSFTVKAVMDDAISKSFDIGVIPDSPSLTYLKKGLRLNVKKSFENTCYIPDFSRVMPGSWTEDANGIRVELGFNRPDVPLPHYVFCALTVNYANSISGWLAADAKNAGVYVLTDDSGKVQALPKSLLKDGVNRISWILQYYDAEEHNYVDMAYSTADPQDAKHDYLFTYSFPANFEPTVISFSEPWNTHFYGTNASGATVALPTVSITKDKDTELSVLLNGQALALSWNAVGDVATLTPALVISTSKCRQGLNSLEVRYTESKQERSKQYSFLFDNERPVASLESYDMGDDYRTLNELSISVKEANYAKALLSFNGSNVGGQPAITILGEDLYRLTWKGLAILPTAAQQVTVTVEDKTGKKNDPLVAFSGLNDITRPEDAGIQDVALNLPLYNGTPAIANEANYANRAFPDHSKFAPERFEKWRGVKNELDENGGYLIRNIVVKKVLASDGTINDQFGCSVSIAGDYAIFGAQNDDDNGNSSGSAYLHRISTGTWTKLVPTDGAANDYFGYSISISGDYVIIGAYADDDKGNDSGSAYIYRISTGTWTKLVPTDGAANDYFGYSVSISGDYAIIGAYRDDDRGSSSGSAYIYRISTGTWTKLTPTDGSVDDYFGFSVSISGDNAIIGAYYDDDRGTASGSAYIYKISTGTWIKLVPTDGTDNDKFGYSVSISGEYAVIGAYGDSCPMAGSGSGYIYRISTGTWTKLVPADGAGSDSFGYSVSISGEYAVIGAYYDNDMGYDSGSAYIYKISNGTWAKLVPIDGAANDKFGRSVSIAADYAIIGAPEDDDMGNSSGTAYIYTNVLQSPPIISTNLIIPENPDHFIIFCFTKSSIIIDASALNGKVSFESLGYKQDPSNLAELLSVPPTGGIPIILPLENARVVEGKGYVYFIVKVEDLKNEFIDGASAIPFGSTDLIYDRASLRIKYDDALNGQRPTDIYLSSESSLAELFVYDRAYEDPLYNPDTHDYAPLNPTLNNTFSARTFSHGTSSDHMSLAFWLRQEDEGRNESGEFLDSTFKRVLTFTDSNNFPIMQLGMEGNQLKLYNGDRSASLSASAALSIGDNLWNLIVLEFDNTTSKLFLSVNGGVLTEVPDLIVAGISISKILEQNASLYFGRSASEQYRTGFFSIAKAFRTNKLLIRTEISQIYSVWDQGRAGERFYSFENAASNIGPVTDKIKLHLPAVAPTDYFTSAENVDYGQPSTQGAFKASEKKQNLFLIKNMETGENCVILRGADQFIRYGVEVDCGQDRFTLEPSGTLGRYYFGDKNGNYNLKTNRWYSVSGRVIEKAESVHARLVVRINGAEQSFPLEQGRFHHVYQNPALIAPEDVKVYIETNGNITLGTDLIFNEGNFILEKDWQESWASTHFIFGPEGTVDFWYKPLMANAEGYVNYSATLFDSEYITISTYQVNDGAALFTAKIKGSSFNLQTLTKVKMGWQHLQLSYSTDHDVVYFYVDGKLAASWEGGGSQQLPGCDSINGNPSLLDNVWLGCNENATGFAQGYFDNVRMSVYYNEALYDGVQPSVLGYPAALTYNESSNNVQITYADALSSCVESASWELSTLDSGSIMTGSAFPVDMSGLAGGRYRIKAILSINGHKNQARLTFNRDSKPRFVVTQRTPILFKDVSTDVKLSFNYDKSYRFPSEQLIFAGLAARMGVQGSSTYRTCYITQDFIDQNTDAWLIGEEDGSSINWKSLQPTEGGLLELVFKDAKASDAVNVDLKYFYITGTFSDSNRFSALPEENRRETIPIASMEASTVYADGIQYKLLANLIREGSQNTLDPDLFAPIEIICYVAGADGSAKETVSRFDADGTVELYYDDILPDYGRYQATLKVRYLGIVYLTETLSDPLVWEKKEGASTTPVEVKRLEIDDFTLLSLDRRTSPATASFLLRYSSTGVGNISAQLDVISGNSTVSLPVVILQSERFVESQLFDGVQIPAGAVRVRIRLEAEDLSRTRQIEVSNDAEAPTLVMTNGVDALITYNNVFFSWRGYSKGLFNEQIAYTYNFDGTGWTVPNPDWRSARFYNLKEGYHVFEVRAVYEGLESCVYSRTFFVDIGKPVFNQSKITVSEIRDAQDVLYAVKLTGGAGAITDASLKRLYADGTEVKLGAEGSFATDQIPIAVDGANKITLTALDKVGNLTDHVVKVSNDLTEILFPVVGSTVKYCPTTIVGRLSPSVRAPVSIYLADTVTPSTADVKTWKKATINADGTFFIENAFVNPGTRDQALLSLLNLAVVFDSGRRFDKSFEVWANEIVMPIELSLSTHAAEGENADTVVTVQCKANVPNISSWSIDYTGDGVYDEIVLVSNPSAPEAQSREWRHVYSSLGLVEPRVRVITTDGRFFSVSDRLIIHEKILDASPKMVTNPISMSVASGSLPGTDKAFVLRSDGQNWRIDAFDIPKNDPVLVDTTQTIQLSALHIDNPVLVRALDNKNLFVASNKNGIGIVYQLTADQWGAFSVARTMFVDDEIRDLSCSADEVVISFNDRATLVKALVKGGLLDPDSKQEAAPGMAGSRAMGRNSGLARDRQGILAADFFGPRVIRMETDLDAVGQFGSLGTGEAQFVKPSRISSKANRILVYDEGRKDVQVFDSDFGLVCTLEYSTDPAYHNYVENGFFQDVADISIVSREDGGRLFYYALILSRSSGKIAMLRLPQWEELRARARNNKLVFIRDGEVFTSKPDGSDLSKVLSSDSLPIIEGTLDYPALAPDGKKLVFTSRADLYGGNQAPAGSGYEYCNLYLMDLETRELQRISLGSIEGMEIERPVFSTGGDLIAFSAKPSGGKWQIYELTVETGEVRQLFTAQENVRFPYYSPDDKYVVFVTDYDGDQDIELLERGNPSMRTVVTKNSARDSFPVWSPLSVEEETNPAWNPDWKLSGKISLVSERNYHKGVYVVYLSQLEGGMPRVFDLRSPQTQRELDLAAIEISATGQEGDYPAFSGDGKSLVFERFDGSAQRISRFDFIANLARLSQPSSTFTLEDVEILLGSRRPAGMKNSITGFTAENRNGNEIRLKWNPYVEGPLAYYVQYQKAGVSNAPVLEAKVTGLTEAVLSGLEMGYKYRVRVFALENDEEVTTSRWEEVRIPDVAARPMVTPDPENPYVVRLHAWKPLPEADWNFTWIIDNQTVDAGESQDLSFEFATSGIKYIQLRARNAENQKDNISDPVEIEIESDIRPVIQYALAEDSSSIDLDASGSAGKKVNWTVTRWVITGAGKEEVHRTGSFVKGVDLSGFTDKINVSLILSRVPVNGQAVTDEIAVNRIIDLDMKAVRPIVTYEVSEKDARLVHFSAEQSVGNIDWYGTQWTIFADGESVPLYEKNGVSSFDYRFPERSNETVYTVSLTVRRRIDGLTQTVSQPVSILASSLEPVIEYEVLTMKQGDTITGAKLLLDATKSKGSGLDFTSAKWSVPMAGSYGEQSMQYGPTALYTLNGAAGDTVLEVALTLSRRNGADPKTVTRYISLDKSAVPEVRLIVNRNLETTSEGQVLVLDALRSTGPNIDWQNTVWQVTVPGVGTVARSGSVIRVDIPSQAQDATVGYTCTLNLTGGQPVTASDSITIGKASIKPIITTRKLPSKEGRYYELSVLDSKGVGIDWERTQWYIYDGDNKLTKDQGAAVAHTFEYNAERLGYSIMVEMFLKGSSLPFVGYQTLDIAGDELRPMITYNISSDKPQVYTFDATTSKGSGIDWNSTAWQFGDGSQIQYGPVITHEYPAASSGKIYRVTLTVKRGTETESLYKEIIVAKDTLKAVVKASLYSDGYLLLSAEESQGRGLLLDRSVWMFPGIGDAASSSQNYQGGVVKRSSSSQSNSSYGQVSLGTSIGAGVKQEEVVDLIISKSTGYFTAGMTLSAETGGNSKTDTNSIYEFADYSDYKQGSNQFSSENNHIGAICRRYVGSVTTQIVTLYVYRMNSDGGIDGESITVSIDLTKAKTSAGSSGVIYGR